ncbi:MAG: hypothetical protein GY761_02140 [Hyphomicrobiales bacterium]|nr:hypothetical protein [Hyphomicrobiales bacterium]
MPGQKMNYHKRGKQTPTYSSGWSWRAMMRIIGMVASISIFPISLQPALGSDFDGKSLVLALNAAHEHLSKQGSGLVGRFESCPGNDQTEWGFKFIRAVDMKPVDATQTAVLIDTGQCSGGNENGQYLVIASSSSADLILADIIGDMRFAITSYHVGDAGTLQLQGVRWKENDPHCCPSQKGTLNYSLDTGVTKYQPK